MNGARLRIGLLFAVASATAGCATSFTGDAHFPGGARGCYDHCQGAGMQMGSMVYMGEYSSACVCEPLGAPAGQQGSAGAAGGAVGVVLQHRAQQQQQQQAMMGGR